MGHFKKQTKNTKRPKPPNSSTINSKDEIVIRLTNANEPPRVTIGGVRVPVYSLNLSYETDAEQEGIHDLNLVYLDLDKQSYKLIGYQRKECDPYLPS